MLGLLLLVVQVQYQDLNDTDDTYYVHNLTDREIELLYKLDRPGIEAGEKALLERELSEIQNNFYLNK